MFNLETINNETSLKQTYRESYIKLAFNLLHDPDKKIRQQERLCSICYYREPGFAGQAFTDKACCNCNKVVRYSTTNTNKLCEKCAEGLRACIHCGADINLKMRRSL